MERSEAMAELLDKLENPEQVFLEYSKTRDIELRNQLLLHYSYIAKTVAIQMRDIYKNYASPEDIINQGIITLMDCIEKFDIEKGVKFESYGFMRVKGSTIDFIRKQDWLPRRVRKTAKDIETAKTKLANQNFREPTYKEIAEYMGVTQQQLDKHFGEITNSVMLSFEGVVQNALEQDFAIGYESGEEYLPENSIFKQEIKQTLIAGIDTLTEKERIVVSLYYYDNLKFYEISKVLEVSESRVCQIHSKAILKLKVIMEKYMNG